MTAMRSSLFIICVIVLCGCSGETGGGKSTSVMSAAQVETAKLQAAIKNDPTYKLDDSEIATLQNEGIIGVADKTKLQSIQ